ncbi:hypothetical protein P885DRAFT_30278 [Corynascus similis CBS 632.67]
MAFEVPPTLPVPIAGLVKHIVQHQDTPLVELLEPYREYEAHLRGAFAQDLDNELLKDPYVNVLPLFTDDTHNIKVRARNLKTESKEEQSKYIMPLPPTMRRPDGSPAVVQSLQEFQRNFNVFCESSLSELDWSNVVAAGSSVVNTLLPVPEEHARTKRSLREYFHEKFSPASDVDLFLYGLTEEQAIEKIKAIETSVRDAILTDTTVVRTKHAITICNQYPTRHIQIVLRIYKSVSEILTGFDIDCSGAAYDGKQVYCTPRALQSYMTQINHIDLSRRSPSYENRLSKYSHRGFEVYFPDLDRSRIDPTIFERSFQRTLGLARLLVLERLPTQQARDSYQDSRRRERGRPPVNRYYREIRSLRGNIKESHEDEVADWLIEDEISNYHTFTIPYGPRFNPKKIEKLCYTRDLLLNAEWNQSDDREVYLHRHPAFFGRVEDVINDCCEHCPIPKTDEEKEIAEEEEKVFVSGKISFMKDDPGRQQIGSFNPLTDDDWTEMAYVGNTARLCQAIVDGDLEHVVDWLAQEGSDPNTRDYTGRTPLHLACMASTPAIVKALVDAGARLVARLADGRTALHLASARGDLEMVKILLRKSAANEAEYEEKKDQRRRKEKALCADNGKTESEAADDAEQSDGELIDESGSEGGATSMATGSFVKVGKKESDMSEDIADDDDEDEPDFYDINVTAWDTPCSALHLAIVNGHVPVVQELVQEYGADVLLPVQLNDTNEAILTLVLALALPVEKAKEMVKTLDALGTTSAQAGKTRITAFHRYVEANAESLLDTLWELDPAGTKSAINHIAFPSAYTCDSPLQVAVKQGNQDLIVKLLDHGADPQIEFEKWLRSANQSVTVSNQLRSLAENEYKFNSMVEQPLILALNGSKPEIAIELLERGADPNVLVKDSHQYMRYSWNSSRFKGGCALDLVEYYLRTLRQYQQDIAQSPAPPTLPEGIDTYLDQFEEGTYQYWVVSHDIDYRRKVYEEKLKEYEKQKSSGKEPFKVERKKAAIAEAIANLEKVKEALLAKGAKTFSEIRPGYTLGTKSTTNQQNSLVSQSMSALFADRFEVVNVRNVTKVRQRAYLRLFTAALNGDLETIKALTLASWSDGDTKDEAPLEIAVYDRHQNNPFSLAYLRGHYDVAKAVLEIAYAQYAPEDAPKTRYTMQEDDDCYSDDGSISSKESEPRIYSQIVDEVFTIRSVGEVSMKVKCHTKPMDMVNWLSVRHKTLDYKFSTGAVMDNDMAKLRFLLDVSEQWIVQDYKTGDEIPSFYSFPVSLFTLAIRKGHVELLGEIIRRTGAGLPLERLVKNSGVELQVKPRYYQGLNVYGKKRNDWAQAGRDHVERYDGLDSSLIEIAALSGRIESVEWLFSDTPLRQYLAFANSKGVRDDAKLKHLAQAPGGFEGAILKWLNDQSELVLHAAIFNRPSKKATELVAYLVRSRPFLVDVKAANGATPLLVAYQHGRLDAARILIEAGADQKTQDRNRLNLLHTALSHECEVKKLVPMLNLLDRDALVPMIKERNKLEEGGQTPLHHFLSRTVHWAGELASDVIRVIKMFVEISPENTRQAFRMLDGTGDTPLHTLLMNNADPAIIRAIVDFDPGLLCIENAVGRTPAEVAQDCYLDDFIRAKANYVQHTAEGSVASLTTADPSTFVKEKGCDEPKEHEARTNVAKNWHFCTEALARNGLQAKRTLVSLDSANFVAQRLARKQIRSKNRYSFQLVKRDEEAPSEPADTDDDDTQINKATTSTTRRAKDFVTERYNRAYQAWCVPEEETEDGAGEGESDKATNKEQEDGLFPVCGTCRSRHYPLSGGALATTAAWRMACVL